MARPKADPDGHEIISISVPARTARRLKLLQEAKKGKFSAWVVEILEGSQGIKDSEVLNCRLKAIDANILACERELLALKEERHSVAGALRDLSLDTDRRHNARLTMLEKASKWDKRSFTGYFTGPVGGEMMVNAGFQSIDEAWNWIMDRREKKEGA